MNKSKHYTKAEKARKKWQLLQEELQLQKEKKVPKEKTIPLKVAHKRETTSDSLADSA